MQGGGSVESVCHIVNCGTNKPTSAAMCSTCHSSMACLNLAKTVQSPLRSLEVLFS